MLICLSGIFSDVPFGGNEAGVSTDSSKCTPFPLHFMGKYTNGRSQLSTAYYICICKGVAFCKSVH